MHGKEGYTDYILFTIMLYTWGDREAVTVNLKQFGRMWLNEKYVRPHFLHKLPNPLKIHKYMEGIKQIASGIYWLLIFKIFTGHVCLRRFKTTTTYPIDETILLLSWSRRKHILWLITLDIWGAGSPPHYCIAEN